MSLSRADPGSGLAYLRQRFVRVSQTGGRAMIHVAASQTVSAWLGLPFSGVALLPDKPAIVLNLDRVARQERDQRRRGAAGELGQ